MKPKTSPRILVLNAVARHHQVPFDSIDDNTFLEEEKRRAILDEVGGSDVGSTNRISVGSLITFLEAWNAQTTVH